ncbi:MAG: sporulation transcription factor Spo0A [Clostridia bacterium]|nr:sporulation transcription factor Spo0A [Clostridia bacterium]MBT7123079.1 sporulation transcription factor Spo0A [Clostridia bacterium]
MEGRIKLLIVDDDAQQSDTLVQYFGAKDDVEVIGACSSTTEAALMIKQTNPDALITDMVMPKADGLSLLERLNSSEFAAMPQTIVVSAATSDILVQTACNLGAKFYLVKPCDNDMLYRRLQDMFVSEDFISRSSAKTPQERAPQERALYERITTMFLSIGIAPHIKGYRYLRRAIAMAVSDPQLIDGITKKLYPKIAVQYDTTASKVERAIRHAIEIAWSRGKIENINRFIGFDIYTNKDKPTNGEFIALIVDKLRLEYGAA